MSSEVLRIVRDEMLMGTAQIVAMRGTCKLPVGAVIAKQGRVISLGYVGSPPGMPHCNDIGCDKGEDGGCTRTTHAEINALLFAARNGIATEGAEMFTTHTPCYSCAKAIVTAGIIRVVWFTRYRKDVQKTAELFRAANIAYVSYQSG